MKKAQAAMEFLLSYGWAILVVLVAIAALSVMIVNPLRITTRRACFLETGFICEDFKISNSTAIFIIKNNRVSDLKNVVLTLESPCVPITNLSYGESVEFNCSVEEKPAGSKYVHSLVLNYSTDGLSHHSVGKVVGNYE